jgi:hypothetical protein
MLTSSLAAESVGTTAGDRIEYNTHGTRSFRRTDIQTSFSTFSRIDRVVIVGRVRQYYILTAGRSTRQAISSKPS